MLKRTLIIIYICLLTSCKDASIVEKPKNIIPEDQMAALMADFAINEQLFTLNPKGNMEESSRFILKKHKTTAKQFSESYKYYLSLPNDMEKILDNAQKIILEQDEKITKDIEKKLKPTENQPKPLNLNPL